MELERKTQISQGRIQPKISKEMDSGTQCKEHAKPLQFICMTCKELMCAKCHTPHLKRGCKGAMDLSSYAAEKLLPKYPTLCQTIDQQKQVLETSLKDFATSLPQLRQSLLLLQERMNKLLKQIQKTLQSLDREVFEPTYRFDTWKASLQEQQRNLETAIENDNMAYIIRVFKGPKTETLPTLSETDRRLLDTTHSSVARLLESKELELLNNSLHSILDLCQNLLSPEWRVIPTDNNFVYGVCRPADEYSRLCQYDIRNKRLTRCCTVPSCCSVLQMAKNIYIAGGYNPLVSTVYELAEDTQTLLQKASMTYPRYAHTLVATSSNSFAALGGYNEESPMAQCEEYIIVDNKWARLPVLNEPRYYAAAVMQSNEYLYVIGGTSNKSVIERLEMKERSAWTCESLTRNEVELGFSHAAFVVSPDEVIILCGCRTSDAGLYNVKTCTIKACSTLIAKKDYYYGNAVCSIGSYSYLIGAEGNIHIYKVGEKKFEDLAYAAVSV